MPGGRPTLWTPEVKQKILSSIANGNFNYIAAQSAGVSYSLLKQWMARGRKEEVGEFREFLAALMVAATKAETEAVSRIMEAGRKEPKYLMWWLERKYPQRWGRDRMQFRLMQKEFAQIKAEHEKIVQHYQAKGRLCITRLINWPYPDSGWYQKFVLLLGIPDCFINSFIRQFFYFLLIDSLSILLLEITFLAGYYDGCYR